jgi:hypothetical protein
MTTQEKVFELILSYLHNEGGDGDAVVECRYEPKETWAKLFEDYINSQQFCRLQRFTTNDNTILFSDGSNENVIFCDRNSGSHLPENWCVLRISI